METEIVPSRPSSRSSLRTRFAARRVKLTALIAATLVCAISPAQTITEPGDQPVSLTGVLRIAHGYGPPGYGEDKRVDVPVSYWVLDLPMKITMACSPTEEKFRDIECGETDRLRLFLSDSRNDHALDSQARILVDRSVVVTGELHRRDAMIQMTAIYMNVTKILEEKGTTGRRSK